MTTPVSLLGLGRMGEPIARRLLAALGSLTVWNRTTGKAAAMLRSARSIRGTGLPTIGSLESS